MPTRNDIIIVNIMKIGRPYFLIKSVQQAITQLRAINETDKIIIIGMLMKYFLKKSEFMAQKQTPIVIRRDIERRV
jgi:hypothetical protein